MVGVVGGGGVESGACSIDFSSGSGLFLGAAGVTAAWGGTGWGPASRGDATWGDGVSAMTKGRGSTTSSSWVLGSFMPAGEDAPEEDEEVDGVVGGVGEVVGLVSFRRSKASSLSAGTGAESFLQWMTSVLPL